MSYVRADRGVPCLLGGQAACSRTNSLVSRSRWPLGRFRSGRKEISHRRCHPQCWGFAKRLLVVDPQGIPSLSGLRGAERLRSLHFATVILHEGSEGMAETALGNTRG